jgi:multidrug resistance efflux pump
MDGDTKREDGIKIDGAMKTDSRGNIGGEMTTENRENNGGDAKTENDKKAGNAKRKNALLIAAAIVIMVGVVIWYYSYVEGRKYFTTDNAKVSASMYPVIPSATGKLVRYTVKTGSYVDEDEIIGRIENGPYIKSPVGGQVVKSNVSRNQVVSPATTVAVVADTNSICVGANIEETDINKIREGQSVIVQLDAFPGRKINAYVSEVGMITSNALTGNLMSFSTSGTYTKTTQLIPIKIAIVDDIQLEGVIGTNATVKIRIRQ